MVCIYLIKNPEGHLYIGKTRNLKKRLRTWACGNKQANRHLRSSINKHGWSNHCVITLHELPQDIEESILNDYEKIYIEFYHANCNRFPTENGMNLTDGGSGCSGMILSDFAKDKLRQLYYEKSFVNLHKTGKESPLFGRKGKDHPAFGFRHTKEAKLKIGICQRLGDHKMAKRVVNIKTGEVFGCVKLAAMNSPYSYWALKAMLNGQNKNKSDFMVL